MKFLYDFYMIYIWFIYDLYMIYMIYLVHSISRITVWQPKYAQINPAPFSSSVGAGQPFCNTTPAMAHWQQARAARAARAARGAAEDNDYNYNDEEKKKKKKKKKEKEEKRRRRRIRRRKKKKKKEEEEESEEEEEEGYQCLPTSIAPLATPGVPRAAPILPGTASARAFAGDAEHQVEPIDPPTSGPEETTAGRDMTLVEINLNPPQRNQN